MRFPITIIKNIGALITPQSKAVILADAVVFVTKMIKRKRKSMPNEAYAKFKNFLDSGTEEQQRKAEEYLKLKPGRKLKKLSEWISVEDRLPAISQMVILFANGVVQEELFMLDTLRYPALGYFWNRDDIDDCPLLSPGQMWMPLPEPPEEKEF